VSVQRTVLIVAAYVVAYVALDWVSYIHPLGPFAITPWNPTTPNATRPARGDG
jgi:hypothetical protein